MKLTHVLPIFSILGCLLPHFERCAIADATEAEADELPLKDGESYFVMVSATNKLGYVNTIHSNGVTVKLEQLLPGNVRDGDIVGKDLNFQQSITTISANWDGFGQSSVQNNGPVFKSMFLAYRLQLTYDLSVYT